MLTKIIKILLLTICFYKISSFCKKETDGFSLGRVNSSLSLPLTNQGNRTLTESILKQPFHYLARGGQMFVFVSEDQKHVLKFFKNTSYPLLSLQKYQLKKTAKLMRDVHGYMLAFERLPEESGLVFLKLEIMTPFEQEITLIDKLGIVHKLPLQKTLFAIQKKGEPLAGYLKKAENVQNVFDSLGHLMLTRRAQGIDDKDSYLQQNIGFINGKPCFLDPGKFTEASSQTESYPEKFLSWVKENYPEALL